MTRSWLKRWFKKPETSRRQKLSRRLRLFAEPLEERILMDADLVVGRTLTAYTNADVQNNQLEITYTVYNEQADPINGVLLTDTLLPGVSFVDASILPDRNGQELAWGLGTIEGFDRASVTLTVALGAGLPTPAVLDTGAHAFAMLNTRAVTDDAPAAALRPGAVAPELLASTPDANWSDPFIQEKAAELDYDPARIIAYLQDEVGYESYTGSLRGARGTLWSSAGNALDEAGLGVALMRASGIPAQYAQGTLSDSLSRLLILSMFPESFQVVGYIPAGTEVADPANDPQLLAETREHYWIQFDTGTGFQDIDTTFADAQVGQTFTAQQGTFTEVADSLRHKVTVRLNAETYSQVHAAFGLGGLSTTTVLDQIFNTVDLVGRPLTIGHFVNETVLPSPILVSRTMTYSPYIQEGDLAFDSSQDHVIRGQDYQEVLTNFPLGNQLLTGLFLQMDVSGPDGPTEYYERALVDRIGFAARQGFVTTSVSVDPNGPPAITEFDIVTVNVLAGMQNPRSLIELLNKLTAIQAQLRQLDAADPKVPSLETQFAIDYTRSLTENVLADSDVLTAQLARASEVTAYADRPRLIIASNRVTQGTDSRTSSLSYAIDLLRDFIRPVAYPGQAANAPFNFGVARGFSEDAVEQTVIAQANQNGKALSAGEILIAAAQQGIPLAILTTSDISRISSLDFSPDTTARVTGALHAGRQVLVPTAPVAVDSKQVTAWFETDPHTGYTIGVMENGAHQGITEYTALIAFATVNLGIFIGLIKGAEEGARLSYLPQDQARTEKGHVNDVTQIPAFLALAASGPTAFVNPFFGIAVGFVGAVLGGYAFMIWVFDKLYHIDPPIFPQLSDLSIPLPEQSNDSHKPLSVPRTLTPASVVGGRSVKSMQVSGPLAVSWSADCKSGFQVQHLYGSGAAVTDSLGNPIGSGPVGLAAPATVAATVSGHNRYDLNGTGNLSFYGAADSLLDLSANWTNYTAMVTGNVTITITTDALTLNGVLLPPGTYTITTTAATLTGSGATSSPSFSGSVSVTTTDGTVEFGPGTGNVTIGGNPLPTDTGFTLTGYNGTIDITAGSGTDTVALNGSAGQVLRVTANPTAITADQNSPATFAFVVETSLADTYTLTATGPAGWTVTIADNGQVTVTPRPGTQAGDFLIHLLARSQSNPDLVAAADVMVTVTPTLPGINFDVLADSVFTVPYAGAQVPTAFRASIQNLGPDADTYDLAFPNPPAGFNILRSLDSVTAPAGETGIVGIYLEPNVQMPAPGTQVSFTVIATSLTDPAITQTRVFTFTMPEVRAVTVTSDLPQLNTIPGAPVSAFVTFTNVGNVTANIATGTTLPTGLTIAGLATPVVLNVGQSTTQQVTFTPDANTPLNSTLTATLTTGPAVTSDKVTVLGVDMDRSFAEPGQPVNISARVQHAVVQPGQALASYVVRDSQGSVVFTSNPVPLALAVITSVTSVNLGMLDTAGFAPGEYTIEATIADANSQPIPGASGQGTLVVGLPIGVRQSVDPATVTEGLELTYVTGEATVTTSMTIAAEPLVGQIATSGPANSVAVSGNLAYVVGPNGIDIVDVTDPARPTILKTIGQGELAGTAYAAVRIQGNEMFVIATPKGDPPQMSLLIYSLAAPLSPQLVSKTPFGYGRASDLLVQGNTIIAPTNGYVFVVDGRLIGQFGTVVSIDISNRAAPVLADELFGSQPAPYGGSSPQGGGAIVNGQTTYIAGTTSAGSNFQTGQGRILVVDSSNQRNLSLAGEVIIPGTYAAFDVGIQGNLALVLGNSGAAVSPGGGYAGKMTLSVLDISDPRNPVPIGATHLTDAVWESSSGGSTGFIQSLGNGQFAVTATLTGGQRALLVVDISDPSNIVVAAAPMPALVNEMAAGGNLLYTTSSAGLTIQRIDALTRTQVQVQIQVPTGTGVAIVPDSFNLAPTRIISGQGFDTLTWDLSFDAARPSQELTWQSAITGMTPGTTQNVTLGVTVQYVTPAGSDTLTLPGLVVGSLPATQSLQIPVRVAVPGADAIANASVTAAQLGNTGLAGRLNDLSIALTNLVQDATSAVFKSQALANLDSVIGQLSGDPILAALQGSLTAGRDALAAASTAAEVQAAVTMLGTAMESLASVLNDLAHHDFRLALAPSSAVLLPQTSTRFDLFLENTGTATTTYVFSVSGLPGNVSAVFSQPSVTLAPGEALVGGPSGVWLELTPTTDELAATGFTVTAAAVGFPAITRSAAGFLTVRDELVQVVEVSTNPPFADPGALVQVTARVLNAVNQSRQVSAGYVVKDSAGQVIVTSTAVPLTLSVTTSLATVNLGSLNTTGLARGTYTIDVSITEPGSGNQVAGGFGQGSLLVGLPVSPTLGVSQVSLPPGDSVVTQTLQIDASAGAASTLSLIGQVQTSGSSGSVVLNGNLAYVAGPNGIDIVDISNPFQPVKLRTFGRTDLGTVSYAFIRLEGSELFVAASANRSANRYVLLTYSIAADPLNPQLISSKTTNYEFITDLLVHGDTIITPTAGYAFTFGGHILGQYGTVLSIDTTDAATPVLADVLFNTLGQPRGGATPQFGGTLVNDHIAYISGTTSSGSNFQTGEGRILVIDYSDPANLAFTSELIVPGTYIAFDVAIQGNRALVLGNSGAAVSPGGGYAGKMTLSVLDITDPLNPLPIGATHLTDAVWDAAYAGSTGFIQLLGNGQFAVTATLSSGQRALLVVDISDPNNLVVTTTQVPALVGEMAAAGTRLYTTSSSGLLIYEVGGVSDIPVTASVQVPNGTGVSIVANSFNVPPTQIISGVDFDTLVWTFTLDSAAPDRTFTWQTQVSALEPGESRAVTLNSTVDFISQNTQSVIPLPPTHVFAEQVLALSPAVQTAQPGEAVIYTVTISNPSALDVSYDLSVAGVLPKWVTFAAQVTVPAGSSVSLPLMLASDPTAPQGVYDFAVIASAAGTASSVFGTLNLLGEPVLPATDSFGVVLTLTPAQVTAGQGTSAGFVVRLINTGSATEFYALTAVLPAGVTGVFAQTIVTVPPGVSNFRDVSLLLTPAAGVTPGDLPFTVTAASLTRPEIQDAANGILTVVPYGVQVTLNPPVAVPGSSLQLTVTNTGSLADTFDLALAGPAALVATLGLAEVTLGPGESQVVTITTGTVDFAVPGSLNLIGMATSRSNPAVRSAATAELSIETTTGLTANFDPGTQVLPVPGNSSFQLLVNNTGNTEEAYMATIIGTNGPIQATLVDFEGKPTQEVPIFRLPGLSSGVINLLAGASAIGQGTVDVEIRSLSGSTQTVATAVLEVGAPSVCGPNSASTPSQQWVEQAYCDLFRRQIDPSGAANWHTLVNQGLTRQQVALLMETSVPEREHFHNEVERLYQKLLHRSADPVGLRDHVAFLAAGGTVEQLGAIIAGSPEYFFNNGNDNDRFLDGMYADLFHRSVDQDGRAAWGQMLSQGATRAQVAAGILNSIEHRTNLLQGYYQQFLHRDADAFGLSAFLAAMEQGVRDEEIIAAILGSAEYLAKIQ